MSKDASNPTRPRRIDDEPLWRLIVMLHDAEQLAGRDAQTVRLLARIIETKISDAEKKAKGAGNV